MIKLLMEKYYEILEKTKGRDKTYKLIQYAIKLIIYKTGNKNLNLVETNLSLTRKILKLFNFIDSYIILVKYFKKPKKNFIDHVEFLFTSFDALSSIIDHIILLIKFNLIPEKIKEYEDYLDKWSKRFWLFDIILERFVDYCNFGKMISQKKVNFYLKLSENLLDINVQFSTHRGTVIYSGILASCVSLYMLFNKKN